MHAAFQHDVTFAPGVDTQAQERRQVIRLGMVRDHHDLRLTGVEHGARPHAAGDATAHRPAIDEAPIGQKLDPAAHG